MAYACRPRLRAPSSGGGMIDSRGELESECDFLGPEDAAVEEEILASNESPEEDRRFDVIVGGLEEAVMDPAFTSLQQSFVDEWCGEFEDAEENKLIYTDLFRQYTQLVERHLDGWLRQRVRDFEMEAFMKMLGERPDEVVGDVIDVLTAMGDFDEFKGMMVAHCKGRGNSLVVTSAPVAAAAAAAARGAGASAPRNQRPIYCTLSDLFTAAAGDTQGTVARQTGDYVHGTTSPGGEGHAGGRSRNTTNNAEKSKW